eukprot:TRINITY_DN6518_c0_g1_i1.p1 TRINITY_DN6518_c0_g1~~TRINITY_DN6518_c0_g1_i1.p1  ORF type:complete len:341 (+),score=95.30 TRINITY_DN6518_c0_g1_i1:23-1024(+)
MAEEAKVPGALAHFETRSAWPPKVYSILACPECEPMARNMVSLNPDKFVFFPSRWNKFPDSGMDDIELGGFTPVNYIRGSHILFLASFHCNDATLSQVNALVALLESFIESMTIVLPFYPMGTMERVVKEGCVATANTVARILSNLPFCGRPTRVMFYDLHTLQNRFYLSGGAIASLHTTVPLLLREIGAPGSIIDSIAFPDEGASKRFGFLFKNFPLVVCGKQRDGDKRVVKIQEGDATGKRVLIVDDMARSGGTLAECAKALRAAGSSAVSCFVAHCAFPTGVWRKFARGGEKAVFDTFYSTNSCPVHVAELPKDDVFKILDLTQQIVEDL